MSRSRLGAAVLSGVVAAQAFPPLDLGVLAWVALVPLLAAIDGVTPRQGAMLAGLQGAVFFGGLLSWIPRVVAGYGHLGWALGLLIGGILVAVLASFHAAFGALIAWLSRFDTGMARVATPFAWVALAEWGRLWPLGGFPWGYLGYTQYRFPAMRGLAPWGGVLLLSLLIVGVNTLLFVAVRPRGGPSRRRLAAAAMACGLPVAIWLVVPAGARAEEGDGPAVRVAAVQGNVPQDEKWQAVNRRAIVSRHLDLTRKAAEGGAELILWPESSTLEPIETQTGLLGQLQEIADAYHTAVVLGSVHRLSPVEYTNAAFLLVPGRGLVDRYDKMRLVPFGETVPLRSVLFFIGPLVQEVGSFTPGTDPKPLARAESIGGSAPGGAAFSMAICYEVIYSPLIARQVREGSTFLATITNDAWFGRSAAPAQHFAMAVMRAAEMRRWLVRAANTGISGIITPGGEVVARPELFETGLLRGVI
ncbi:MAG: apolipoprotein N-acyltransferase, partial [Acidobacteriota bacterium]